MRLKRRGSKHRVLKNDGHCLLSRAANAAKRTRETEATESNETFGHASFVARGTQHMHSPRSPVIPISPVGNPKKSIFTSRDPAPPAACKVMETISENIRTIGQQFAMTKPAPCGSVVAQAAHVPSLLVSRSRSKLHFLPNHPSL